MLTLDTVAFGPMLGRFDNTKTYRLTLNSRTRSAVISVARSASRHDKSNATIACYRGEYDSPRLLSAMPNNEIVLTIHSSYMQTIAIFNQS